MGFPEKRYLIRSTDLSDWAQILAQTSLLPSVSLRFCTCKVGAVIVQVSRDCLEGTGQHFRVSWPKASYRYMLPRDPYHPLLWDPGMEISPSL